MTTKNKGNFGEDAVVDYLKKCNFIIAERNFKKQCGEIDIIAFKEQLIIFVEVKMRFSETIDLGELIGSSKRKKIIMTANLFLSQYDTIFNDSVCRFDVALVTIIDNQPKITYLKNAFFENE